MQMMITVWTDNSMVSVPAAIFFYNVKKTKYLCCHFDFFYYRKYLMERARNDS